MKDDVLDSVKLTAKQARFVDEYLIDGNATQAMIRAGYKEKYAGTNADKILKNTKIANAVKAGQKDIADRNKITVDDIIGVIKETIDRCRQSSPVVDRNGDPIYGEDEEGNLKPIYRYDAGSVLKGAELLGKHLGMFEPKADDDDATPAPIKVVIEVKDGRKPESNNTSS